MSPLTLSPRPVRLGAAIAGAAGVLLLAGCGAGTETAAEPDAGTSGGTTSDGATTDAADAGSGAYADGTYTAEGTYLTPETVESVSVTVTLEADVITAVEVSGDPQTAETERYQGEFIGGISAEVVGQDIDEISVSRVAGSSLTSQGFNEAIDAIKAEAAS
ncbi:hypothetical protein P0L94_02295 [Microbacter sp. GSS18]|nr:hypothetical protein P0L94_02295 [Microbacter sp. GSS18]